jgi:hypothetical protein
MRKLFKKEKYYLFFIVVVSILAIYPLLAPGFYSFSDEPHIANLYQMIRALKEGQFPPRWVPDMSFGFGYPLFNFYYVLPFYIGAFFNIILGTSLVWSLKLTFLLSIPLSGFSFYFFMRKFFGQAISFSSAVLYIFTPYRALDLYVRGAVGEMWSFVFMPLVLLGLVLVLEKRSSKNIAFLGLSLAGLILAHNLSAMIFIPVTVLFALFFLFTRKSRVLHRFFSLASGGILGIGISAYYWLPAVVEKRFVEKGTPFNLIDHFPFIKQLILPSWGHGASVWGPTDEMSFQIGLLNIAAVALAFLVFFYIKTRWHKNQKFLFYFSASLFVFVLFLMNIRSLFIWNLFPLFSYIQFPWRLLMLTTLFSSILAGFALEVLHKKFKFLYIPVIFSFLAVILTWNYFKPEKSLAVDDNYYLRRFFVNRTIEGETEALSQEYFGYSEDYLPLTIWTRERPDMFPEAKMEITDGELEFQEISSIQYQAKTKSDNKTNLVLHSYYFPGWKAWIDGLETKIFPQDVHGDMAVELDAGVHEVTFRLTDTVVRRTANIVSLISILGLVTLMFVDKIFPKRKLTI